MSFGDPGWLEEERRCLAALRGGDVRGFDRLYAAFAAPLYRRVLLPRLADQAAAEEALAETFRRAFERLDQWEDRGKGLWPYLSTIALNIAHDMHRERARSGRALASFESLLAPLLEEIPPGPDDAADQTRLRAAVERVLSALHPRYRRALELRYFQDHTREECAAQMGVKLGTFDVLLLRALRAFQQRWQEYETKVPTEARSA